MRTLPCIVAMCFIVTMCSTGCAPVEGNRYNPYVHRLPGAEISAENQDELELRGAHAMTIQEEAAHRAHWKEEVYPVVFGERKAPNEILVFIDYAAPESERLWREVVRATRQLNARTSKVVVFGNSREKYGTELMGGGIWVSYSRPEKGVEFFSYTLNRWNAVKAAHRRQGKHHPFVYEYDATITSTDFPILYAFFNETRPPVPAEKQMDLVRYSYDAGNVNMFQAVAVSQYYGVKSFPAVVVNDVVVPAPTAEKIVAAATRQ